MILRGGLVAYPTDTVYGLGCDPFNRDAVERLVKAKERTKGSLPVLASSLDGAQRLGVFSNSAAKLAQEFWPGPLTLVVPVMAKFPDHVTSDSSAVGLRVPNHEVALKLISSCNGAVIGTSANISGYPSPRTAPEILRQLKDRIDLVLDGGPSPIGRASTVVKVFHDEIAVLREGAISARQILKTVEVKPVH